MERATVMQASKNIVNLNAYLLRLAVSTVLTFALFGTCLRALGTPSRETVMVYLYNSSHVPMDQSSVDCYQEGHIFDILSTVQIGDVPDSAEGSIKDGEGHTIGFIAPSDRASAELPDNGSPN